MRGTLLAIAGFEDGGSGCKQGRRLPLEAEMAFSLWSARKMELSSRTTEAEFYNSKEQQTDPSIEPPERSPLPIVRCYHTSDLQNFQIINLCSYKLLILW